MATNSTNVYSQFDVVGWPQTVHMYSQFIGVGWPQTVHVSLVLYAVASCALLAQLGSIYERGIVKKLFLPTMRGSRPGTLFSLARLEVQFQHIVIQIVHTNTIV